MLALSPAGVTLVNAGIVASPSYLIRTVTESLFRAVASSVAINLIVAKLPDGSPLTTPVQMLSTAVLFILNVVVSSLPTRELILLGSTHTAVTVHESTPTTVSLTGFVK